MQYGLVYSDQLTCIEISLSSFQKFKQLLLEKGSRAFGWDIRVNGCVGSEVVLDTGHRQVLHSLRIRDQRRAGVRDVALAYVCGEYNISLTMLAYKTYDLSVLHSR
jgi:hypothetical protein